jgi:hypothetical protein
LTLFSHRPAESHFSFNFLSIFSVLLFHTSFVVPVSLSSLVISVHSYSMCLVVSKNPQKRHSVDGVFSTTCLCVARVYPVLSLESLDTSTCCFLLRLVESSIHSIASFLNLKMFSLCAHLSCLFFA